jgi:hypothetical protein
MFPGRSGAAAAISARGFVLCHSRASVKAEGRDHRVKAAGNTPLLRCVVQQQQLGRTGLAVNGKLVIQP